MSNTELGVVYPPRENSAEIKKSIIKALPFKFPPRKMEKNEIPFLNDIFFTRKKNF